MVFEASEHWVPVCCKRSGLKELLPRVTPEGSTSSCAQGPLAAPPAQHWLPLLPAEFAPLAEPQLGSGAALCCTCVCLIREIVTGTGKGLRGGREEVQPLYTGNHTARALWRKALCPQHTILDLLLEHEEGSNYNWRPIVLYFAREDYSHLSYTVSSIFILSFLFSACWKPERRTSDKQNSDMSK